MHRILGDFRWNDRPKWQSRQTNSRWIGSRPISIKTPNNTSENTAGGFAFAYNEIARVFLSFTILLRLWQCTRNVHRNHGHRPRRTAQIIYSSSVEHAWLNLIRTQVIEAAMIIRTAYINELCSMVVHIIYCVTGLCINNCPWYLLIRMNESWFRQR